MSPRHMLYLLLTFAASAAVAQTAVSLRNADLDEPLPLGWSSRTAFGPCQFTLDSDTKRSGNASLRADLGRFGGGTLTQTLPVSESGPLSFGCWVRTRLDPADGVSLYLAWLNAQGEIVEIGQPSATAGGSGDWRPLCAIGQRPPAATTAALKIVIGQGKSPDGGQVWVDAVSLRPGLDVAGAFANAGAEQDADGDSHPDGWRPFIAGGGFLLSRDCTVARSGQCSARLQGLAGHGDRSCYTLLSSPCTPAPRLRLRLAYQGTGENAGFLRYRPAPGIATPDGKEFYDTQSFVMPLPKAEWTEFSFEATTPAAALKEKLMIVEVTLYQRGEGTLWLDDLSVEALER